MTHHNVDLLKLYANEHYDTGGHWVAECWDTVDYVQLLYRCKNDLDEAKLELRAHWEQVDEQASSEIQADDILETKLRHLNNH